VRLDFYISKSISVFSAGIFLTSWTFIGDGMPDFLKEKPTHINFIKRRKAAELLLQIELHQSAIYNLSPVRSIVEFLDNAFSSDKSNEDLWEMSLALEPKEREGASFDTAHQKTDT
jgi:son of sevenless-like protein